MLHNFSVSLDWMIPTVTEMETRWSMVMNLNVWTMLGKLIFLNDSIIQFVEIAIPYFIGLNPKQNLFSK